MEFEPICRLDGKSSLRRILRVGYLLTADLYWMSEHDGCKPEDITQRVFSDLAVQLRRGRGPFTQGPCALGGWLHRHTCFVAANTRRSEQRRQVREQIAIEMNNLDLADEPDWQQLAPVLDETLNQLEPADRHALLLRFYERRDLRTVGASLGVSEDAAQKRVARALEKLRGLLAARGVALGIPALSALLGERAVQAAPIALAPRVCEAAITAGASAGVGLGVLGMSLATTHGKIAVGLVMAGAVLLALIWPSSRQDVPPIDTAGTTAVATVEPHIAGGADSLGRVVGAETTMATPGEWMETDSEVLHLTFVAADSGRPVPNVTIDYWRWDGASLDRKTLHGTRLGTCAVVFPPGTTTQLQVTTVGMAAGSRRGHSATIPASLPDPLEWMAGRVFDQLVDPPGDLGICTLPKQIVLPRLLGEDQPHDAAGSLRDFPFPDSRD
jgi:RNA polymerase sigma factor (sigma-70 family)